MADPAVRTALIDAAARLLAAEGPAALSTRRLAAEVGTSTMRIYTHFGSMSDLHAAVRREGFSRLVAAVGAAAAADADDPVAGLVAGCAAYLRVVQEQPELYRAMFNHRPPVGDDAGSDLFELLRQRLDECAQQGRFLDADPATDAVWAGEIWAALHGIAVLALAGALARETTRFMLADMLFRLLVGFGDAPVSARRSIDAAG